MASVIATVLPWYRRYKINSRPSSLAYLAYMHADVVIVSNQHSVTVIHLMLDDLCRPAGEVFRARLHIQGLILHLDGLIALTRSRIAEKGQAALLGVVRAVLFDDLRIEHHGIRRRPSALIEKGDDALAHAYHISCHTNTTFTMSHKCFK